MGEWYQTVIVDTGRAAALWVVIGFLVTYGITRRITLRIRARSLTSAAQPTSEPDEPGGIVKDIHIGGVHVHHQVWGILLVLLAGLLEFRYSPGSPWQEILGAAFGAGAALALDEFALWLHVEDVYWSAEGRKSIDAVMIAVVIGLGLLLTTSPFGISESADQDGLWVATTVVLVHLGYTILCLLKGKVFTGLIGFAVPIVSFVGSIRLAKPESYWAKRHYDADKLERSRRRFADDAARIQKWRDRFGAGESLRSEAIDVDAEAGGAQPVGEHRADP